MPEKLPDELAARLACLMEPYQWYEFLRVCEASRDLGNGYAEVTAIFRPGAVDIRSQITVKPRPDQSGMLRRG